MTKEKEQKNIEEEFGIKDIKNELEISFKIFDIKDIVKKQIRINFKETITQTQKTERERIFKDLDGMSFIDEITRERIKRRIIICK